jgi:Cu(I)/Ag(I) efflux system membrane fusion protein/cobalt-zinc-cadmium efflux system membrane fusion protein
MDPTYIRNEPGKSPMGMDLVPVYKEDVAGGPTILIDPVTEQNMGLRYDVVRMGPLEKTVRTVGTIEYNEQSLGTVTTKIDGWVEKVYVNETGTQVHEGDALFEFYSPQLFSTQEEYLVALRDFQRTGNAVARDLAESRLQSARDRLRFYDISDPQIERLEREGKINKTLTVTAGLTGIVTHRNVTEGDSLKAGQSAYKIADLSTIWAIGKVYESDLPYIRLGQEAQMRLAYLPGRSYSGRVTYVYPYLQPGTREIPVRMEFHNPGYLLKPGMYATLELHTRLEEKAVLVPSMAVIDTGERQVVFVRREAGKFEPRRIKVGLRTSENELQVLSGLAPGEQIVVSGQFLIDSESRLREATLKMLNPGSTNTTDLLESEGAQHDPTTDGSMTVMTDSEAGPLRYVCPMLGHAGILYDQPGDCPLCGMNLVPVHSTTDGEAASRISHYTCPMPEHYSVREEQPGKCPLCSMTMIPVTQQESERFTQAAVKGLPPQLYTCPIPSHAEVVSDQPIRCPHCGRTLVPTEAVPHGAEAESRWRITQSSDSGTTSPLPLYTCPMENHAHVVSAEAGRCPECNMALVPTSEVAHGEQAEAAWREREPQP